MPRLRHLMLAPFLLATVPGVWAQSLQEIYEAARGYDATYLAFPNEDPKRMESTITESLFPPFVGLTAHAIYEFDGATLIFASNEPGVAETPTEFVPGGGTRVWELTKQ